MATRANSSPASRHLRGRIAILPLKNPPSRKVRLHLASLVFFEDFAEWLPWCFIMGSFVLPIVAFKDNYIWLLRSSVAAQCVLVDPGDAAPVLDVLQQLSLSPTAILLTHHHHDHVGGVAVLKEKYPHCLVYAPIEDAAKIAIVDKRVGDGENIASDVGCFAVMAIAGHTLGHIAYYGAGKLFCGDTLFAAGCGRVFEGTMAQMYTALQKIAALPDSTEIYCGHEYTEKNVQFARLVEPDNQVIIALQQRVVQLRQKNQPTLPSTLAIEKATNPFLRCDVMTIRARVEKHFSMRCQSALDVFSALRRWKDAF